MLETSKLNKKLRIVAPDDFYDALIKAHEGLSQEQSNLLNARLIFLLANEVGDDALLRQAITAAREDVT